MNELEKLSAQEHKRTLPVHKDWPTAMDGVMPIMQSLRIEIVAQALTRLWSELDFDGSPLIFSSPPHGQLYTEYHPLLLDQLVEEGSKRKKLRKGQIDHWKLLAVPAYAQGIAATLERGTLLKADMLRDAEPGDRNTVPARSIGWFC